MIYFGFIWMIYRFTRSKNRYDQCDHTVCSNDMRVRSRKARFLRIRITLVEIEKNILREWTLFRQNLRVEHKKKIFQLSTNNHL